MRSKPQYRFNLACGFQHEVKIKTLGGGFGLYEVGEVFFSFRSNIITDAHDIRKRLGLKLSLGVGKIETFGNIQVFV